jgi:aldehyde dehydrogenase (NAD+)
MTKFSNAGQMCVAPDYLLVHESVKEDLIAAFKQSINNFFGADAALSYDYGRIINEQQFNRLSSYLEQGNILLGGNTNKEQLYIEPTLMDQVSLTSPIMNEEIFGPILPILTFSNRAEAKAIIAKHKNPLAFYVFTSDSKKEAAWIAEIPFGGGCVNNAALHLTNHRGTKKNINAIFEQLDIQNQLVNENCYNDYYISKERSNNIFNEYKDKIKEYKEKKAKENENNEAT